MTAERTAAQEELQALIEDRKDLNLRIALAKRKVQALCDHRWKLHQVVGDGRYCQRCDLNDPFFDD